MFGGQFYFVIGYVVMIFLQNGDYIDCIVIVCCYQYYFYWVGSFIFGVVIYQNLVF